MTLRINGPALPRRREVLAGLAAAGAATASLATAPARAQSGGLQAILQAAFADGAPFTPQAVSDIAKVLARKPFVPPETALPDPFGSLTYERYVGIKVLPTGRVWEDEGRGFVVEPLPRGFVFTTGVTLFTVEDGQVRRIVFDKSRFDFGGIEVPPNAPDLGFSGVRLVASRPQPFEFAIIQGASFFRALARGQNFGLTARALTLKAAEQRGEEFPLIRALWLERPNAGSNALVVHALLDSESVAGAVRMTFRPGDSTIVDVETTLHPRVALEHVGFGSMGATYLFSPSVRRTTDDVRAAAYEVGGLSMLNGQGEWLWRPLNNPDTLQVSAFIDEKPKGFGLIQRERDFAAFQDDAQHFERRPSLWVEPIGEWAQGSVQLVEIPSDADTNKNILAYWRPKAPMPAGQEVSVAYRQFWGWLPPERPGLASVSVTRAGRGSNARRRRFLVEFTGDVLAQPPADLKPALTASPGTISRQTIVLSPDRKAVRVMFDLEFGSETACELRMVLQSGGKPLSETWLYRWTP